MLLTLPLEIWEIIFALLPGQDLQLISEVPRLRVLLATARRSAHRLEVCRAGLVDISRPGSRPLAQRVELLKTYRARWESLRPVEVTRLSPRFLWAYHFAGNVLAYVSSCDPPVVKYLRLPSGGVPASSWEDDQLGLEHDITSFSAYPEKNLLAVLEEWFDDDRVPHVRLNVMRLDSARDIVVPHNGQLKVCQPFTADIDLNLRIRLDHFSYEIQQTEHRLAVLIGCYPINELHFRAKFVMWDLITQEEIANITSRQYRSFVFLDHRRALFGAIRRAGRQQQPYLEISDPTNPTNAIVLELDESVLKHASQNSIINISLWTGAGREHGPLTGNGDLPFVPDTSRGIVAADVSLFHRDRPSWRDGPPRFESYVFLMDIEDTLAKDSSPPNLEQSCTEWEDLPSSAATFHYHSPNEDRYALSSRSAYVSGFRYASPVRPLLENPDGPRCFFVYDFNPYRETSGFLPSSSPEVPEPGVGYPRSASEITREVIGGLGCWRMRFDLPAKDEYCTECHVSLTDGGVALFERNHLGEESITIFSMW